MTKVVCFGEALIDFLNTDKTEEGGLMIPRFSQFPGGAPANAAVAVAKLGGRSYFAGQVGDDVFGHFLADALSHYSVKLDYCLRHPSAKTALAFVSLDDDGDRSFSFYRDESADLVVRAEQFPLDMLASEDILHICSNTLTTSAIASTTFELCARAHQSGALVSFDVNLRHNLWPDGNANREVIEQTLRQANIIKFSLDELEYLTGTQSVEAYIAHLLSGKCHILLLTNGGQPVQYFTRQHAGSLPIPTTEVVDTTCGGDGFIGGFLYMVQAKGQAIFEDEEALRHALTAAIACGAHTVARKGAFTALPNAKDLQSLLHV